ncbi:MAG TPA: hypothetical protein VFZ16_06885 [Hyphomicrobiaceae bacterium]|nr:hypothetical protein [Hyphomicrobiaceae bacterium]
MKTLLAILALAGAIALADAPVQQWIGVGGQAVAQRGSSACFQNCANVRRWPAEQCRAYCKGRSKR